MRLAIFFSGFAGMSAVALSAATSHMGPDMLSIQQISWMETAIKYQTWHAIALLAVSCLSELYENSLLRISGYLFMLGIIIFCGSLYLLIITGNTALGIATPFGGASFILGWGLCAIAGIKIKPRKI